MPLPADAAPLAAANRPDEAIADALRPLLDCGPLKVWSIIVTLLGDACNDRQDRLSGRQLDQMLTPLGISNQALRVALHRLKRDGWVDAEKQGRTSHYRLTDRGWQETETVRPRIYQTPLEPNLRQDIWLLVAPPNLSTATVEALLPTDAIRLNTHSALALYDARATAPESPPKNWPQDWIYTFLPTRGAEVPTWLRNAVLPGETANEYNSLHRAIPELSQSLEQSKTTQSLQRLLVLHHWRRLRLRHGELPVILLQNTWPGAQCAQAVKTTLDRLPLILPQ
jgi:phenylacetic acid degradation operon negative regulatory protein